MIQIVTPTTLSSTQPRKGFAPDLSRGFDLRAPERLTYLGRSRSKCRPRHWSVHRFVTFDGRLVTAALPLDVYLYVWAVGRGLCPSDSVCSRGNIWGRVRPQSIHALASAELGGFYRLWRAFGPGHQGHDA